MLNLHKNVIKSVVVGIVVGIVVAGILATVTPLGVFPIVFFAWVAYEIATVISFTKFKRGQ